ncbi:hypothetical protein GSI_11514 [Ganoderma sinense ZZ0214-1]|uniref:Uncharacterized protein n=1 Tax=Ganoderma sinense ZZ0214-1 TaxID=1077348 RepID=A0A2G8RWA8_9APHY|nr:hypothetical protein GSI_11514 [Ganoderma sinense ZZ0214-1]
MDSTYFTAQAQALYQIGARALGMGSGQPPPRREITTSGSSEASDSLDPSAMDIELAGSPMHFNVSAGTDYDSDGQPSYA